MGKDWCDNENLTTTMIFFGFQLFRTCIEAAEGHDSIEFWEDLDAGDPERKRDCWALFGANRAKKMCGSGMDLEFLVGSTTWRIIPVSK